MPTPQNKSRHCEKLVETIRTRFAGRFSVDRIGRDNADLSIVFGDDLSTGKRIVVQASSVLSRTALIRLRHEATALRVLKSDRIAKHVDAAFEDGYVVFVDEFVEGIPLDRFVVNNRLTIRQSVKIAVSMFEALRDLHASRVQHNDVRPQKLIVEPDNTLKLVRRDLTLGHISEANTSDQLERASYLSPEQAGSIERDVSSPSDLYSAGAVLFFVLTGRPPFVASDLSALLLSHMTAPVPKFDELEREVPFALEKVVHRLLTKDPGDRYQSADGVLYDLRRIADAMDPGESNPDLVIASHDNRTRLTEPSFVGRKSELQRLTPSWTKRQQARHEWYNSRAFRLGQIPFAA